MSRLFLRNKLVGRDTWGNCQEEVIITIVDLYNCIILSYSSSRRVSKILWCRVIVFDKSIILALYNNEVQYVRSFVFTLLIEDYPTLLAVPRTGSLYKNLTMICRNNHWSSLTSIAGSLGCNHIQFLGHPGQPVASVYVCAYHANTCFLGIV